MKVKLARTAGFCMGVRRAVELVLEEANRRRGRIVTFGPLIHNAQVLDLLATKGIKVISDLDQLSGQETAVIRAHGVPPEVERGLKMAAGRVINATCPRVVKVQVLIRRYIMQGFEAIIVGDVGHAEIKGLLGHAQGRGVLVSGPEDAAALPEFDKVMVVAQTTQNKTLFDETVRALKARWPEALIFDTICHATHERQAEAITLARQVDGLVVVGGSFSANTQRLVKIAAEAGTAVFAVETEAGLDLERLKELKTIGVTAGASTPSWLIKRVVEDIRGLRGQGQGRLGSAVFRVFRFLLKSNTLVALGGAGLALAGGLAQNLTLSPALAAVPFLYLYAMHVLNHFLDKEATVYNDPDRIRFLTKHRLYLLTTATFAAALGVSLSAALGLAPLVTLAVLSVLGLIYSVPLVPVSWRRLTRYAKMKDLPGSKPLGIALAWGTVCGLWPALTFGHSWPQGGLIFGLIAGLAFVRATIFDILDVQGDLVVGKETLAILLGEDKTLGLLKGLNLTLLGLAAAAVAWGWMSPAGLILAAPPAGLAAILWAYEKKRLLPGIFLEGVLEGTFLLAGLLAAAVLGAG